LWNSTALTVATINFVETLKDNGFVAVKVNGSLTFSMARKLEDRFAIIIDHLRSTQRMSSVALDLTVCPDLDFTGAMAIKKVLSLCAPRVQPSASSDVADLYNLGTMVYVVGASARVLNILIGAGVFEHSIAHGGWPLLEMVDLDAALVAFPSDASDAASIFPGSWHAPLCGARL
jgi:MFS superfamily sulfate permease-like transporter